MKEKQNSEPVQNYFEHQPRRFPDETDTDTDHTVHSTRASEWLVSIQIQICLQEGMVADIVMFRPQAVADTTLLQSIATGRNSVGLRSVTIDRHLL